MLNISVDQFCIINLTLYCLTLKFYALFYSALFYALSLEI